MATNEPPNGARHTAYFRSTFSPTQPVSAIRFSGIIDDGAVFYLDGTELTRINMPEPAGTFPDVWLQPALVHGSETVAASTAAAVTLPAGVPVEIAVSVHNVSPTSSDQGFDLRIYSVNHPLDPPVFADIVLNVIVHPTIADSFLLSWNSTPGETYTVEVSEDLQLWFTLSDTEAGDISGINTFTETPPEGSASLGFYRVSQN